MVKKIQRINCTFYFINSKIRHGKNATVKNVMIMKFIVTNAKVTNVLIKIAKIKNAIIRCKVLENPIMIAKSL